MARSSVYAPDRKTVVYESTDGVSSQVATFCARNAQGLPSIATHWLNDGDHVVFASKAEAIDFLTRSLHKLGVKLEVAHGDR